jgi:ATP-dependent Clp protease ATP-binding subunit ClpX
MPGSGNKEFVVTAEIVKNGLKAPEKKTADKTVALDAGAETAKKTRKKAS